MAGWISSKLKVAENLLQQIDQQAAESLGKNDKPRRSSSAVDLAAKLNNTPPAAESVPRATKFPLVKKSAPSNPFTVPPPDLTKVSFPPSPCSSPKPALDPIAIDWTELLSSPSPTVRTKAPRYADDSAVLRSSHSRVAKKPAISKSGKGSSLGLGTPSSSSSSFPLFSSSIVEDRHRDRDRDRDGGNELRQGRSDDLLLPHGNASVISESGTQEIVTNFNGSREDVAQKKTDLHFNVSSKPSPGSDRDSDSNTDSSSSGSDSEEETRGIDERRKRREDMLAEKAVRAAEEAIREKVDIVTRLEGEKHSLEKILEERERQQAIEASELQTSMMETMEAVDMEKQKHNSTRMEALARLAELEAQNTELSKAFAVEQWNLEVAMNLVAELKQQIELKELAQEERGRRMSGIKHQASSPGMLESLKKDKVEIEILDAEYSFTCDKIERLKENEKRLEESIEKTKRGIFQPTEVELELKKRLIQLTDHLIQKQTQVEALSSEKATLVFRMERMSSMHDENVLSQEEDEFERVDIESGRWKHSDYATKAALRERIRSGRQQLGLVIRQLDAIFSAGAIFLRRNRMAQFYSLTYLLCLHLWVFFILKSHSQIPDGARQGALFSLETISNSSAQ